MSVNSRKSVNNYNNLTNAYYLLWWKATKVSSFFLLQLNPSMKRPPKFTFSIEEIFWIYIFFGVRFRLYKKNVIKNFTFYLNTAEPRFSGARIYSNLIFIYLVDKLNITCMFVSYDNFDFFCSVRTRAPPDSETAR